MRETGTGTTGAIKGLKTWLAVSVTLLALLGVLGSGASAAFAAGAPTVGEQTAENVTQTTATIKGKVNPGGFETYVSVEYNGSFTAPVRVAASEAEQAVSFALAGLQPGTNYAFHLHAVNSEGEVNGSEQKFQTLTPPAPNAETPWWHLTSGARPSYLHAGAGEPQADEVQEVTVNATGGEFALTRLTKQEVSEEDKLFTPPPAEEPRFVSFPVNAEPSAVQAGLEAGTLYGPGNVEVTGSPGHYRIEFKGSLAYETVPLVNTELGTKYFELKGTETATQLVAGHAEVPDGEIYVTAENVGDANVNGSTSTVTFTDVLPKGLKAIAVAATKPEREGDFHDREFIPCSLGTVGGVTTATCTISSALAPFDKLAPYDQLEMRIGVNVEAGAESEPQENEVSISGGGAEPASLKRPVTISSAPVPFGVDHYEMALEEAGGTSTTQSGAHPFQLNTTITLNQLRDINPSTREKPEVTVPALTKDLNFKLPPGLIGNPSPIPQCTITQFFETVKAQENRCPPDTAVGVAVVTVHEPAIVGTVTLTEPIFNIEPRVGEPARFGFYVVIANSPVLIDTSVRTGSDYGVTVSVDNITQTAAFLSSEVTFWGTPGDPRHDNQRGWGCLYQAREALSDQPCTPAGEQHPKPFLSLPTDCESALGTSVTGDSWSEPQNVHTYEGAFAPSSLLGGCNRLQFAPEIKAAPDGQEASKPTGLTVDVHVPQEVNNNASGLASSNVKDIAVKLPAGVAVNPSSADGLEACSEGLVGFTGFGEFIGARTATFTSKLPGSFGTEGSEGVLQPGVNFCAAGSKLGEATIKTPLLPNPVKGFVYLAAQEANPFGSVLAMYIVAEDPVSGSLVKLPGEVQICQGAGEAIAGMTCETQGQLITTFESNPQLAFEDAELHFFGGERAPLTSPTRCGTYTTAALFTPWSGTAPVKSTSSFEINSGPNHSACPGASLPFSPTLTGGATNIQAGAFSPFTLTMSRLPGEQNLQSVEAKLPPGLSGILSNIELCPEPQANAGACGPNSLIGETTVSVGVGGSPFTVSGGKFFLTGPYNGTGGCAVGTAGCAPFGITFEVPAKAGPFDFAKTARNHPACDCVLVRGKIEINPLTAAITIVSNPPGTPDAIPTHLEGIPLEIQKVNAITTRSNFQFNPTNCNKMAVTGTIHSSEGGTDTIDVPLQVTNCGALKFAPKFSVSTKGANSKANGATLIAKLTYPSAPQGTYANITRVKVDLPKQLPSRLTTLQKACTSAQFEANPANCPKESKIGFAKVTTPLLPVPLEGPAIFVSHGGEAFPSLTMVLQGYGVTVDLVGTTNISKAGITSTTFKTVPDTPFSSFTLTLPQGKFSALAANVPAKNHYSLCGQTLAMPTEFLAQNGLKINESTKISVTGCAKKKTLTRTQKLTAALKVCHKKAKGKRAGCETQAHKKYGPLKQTKKKGK
jgi:hypothetical protein